MTFGICTSGKEPQRLAQVIKSIDALEIPGVQIIVVNNDICEKDMHITRKKNFITKSAKHDIIVYLHDYIVFDPNWFKGMQKFGWDWDIQMNIILNLNGDRYRDWTLWYEDVKDKVGNKCLLPYDVNKSHLMYISGAYWIAKKRVMQEFPLNEDLVWGESEDVEWSKRIREKYNFTMNQHCTVRLLKQKRRVFEILDYDTANYF